jgi:hypothetical protein
MGEIGQLITRAEETVSARPALATEAGKLAIRPGCLVLTITRTYHTAEQPAETADIVIPAERFALVYQVPARYEVHWPQRRHEHSARGVALASLWAPKDIRDSS